MVNFNNLLSGVEPDGALDQLLGHQGKDLVFPLGKSGDVMGCKSLKQVPTLTSIISLGYNPTTH